MDPWEQLIKTINGTVYDPVTKTPIHIDNQNLAVTELQKRESPEAISKYMSLLREISSGLPVTGGFNPTTKEIDLTINPWATHEDYRQALSHEKMHQALNTDAAGGPLPQLKGKDSPEVIKDYLSKLLTVGTNYAPGPGMEQQKGIFGVSLPWSPMVPKADTVYPQALDDDNRKYFAISQFDKSQRAGRLSSEYPVYMMANPKDMSVTPEQSDEYTKRYVKQLPVKVGKRVVDIRNQMGAPKPKTITDLIPSGKKK